MYASTSGLISSLFFSSGGAAGTTSDEASEHYVDRLIEGLGSAANSRWCAVGTQRTAMSHGQLLPSVESGIDAAKKLVSEGRRPVILLEHADRMHDSTYVFREVLRRKLPRTAVPYLCDPDASAEAVSAGVGATVSLKVGGKSSERAGGPVVLDGKGFMRGNSSTVLPAPTRREAR